MAGTARAVLVVFDDRDGDSGISFRLALIPRAARGRRAAAVSGYVGRGIRVPVARPRHPCPRGSAAASVSPWLGRGIRVPISLAGGALSTPFRDMLPRKRDMMGR
ncbi:hypothetical protein B2K11_10860 [Microbacterium sp. B35-30]|nr:hypothetical protein B2K11_10860 [Microbacterium sp. B35-30]